MTSFTMREFAAEITRVSKKYGIGIEGGTVYVREADDAPCGYIVDENSRLVRTSKYDVMIAEADARDGDPDLEDCDSEDSDEDGAAKEDDEPDCPPEVWETPQ